MSRETSVTLREVLQYAKSPADYFVRCAGDPKNKKMSLSDEDRLQEAMKMAFLEPRKAKIKIKESTQENTNTPLFIEEEKEAKSKNLMLVTPCVFKKVGEVLASVKHHRHIQEHFEGCSFNKTATHEEEEAHSLFIDITYDATKGRWHELLYHYIATNNPEKWLKYNKEAALIASTLDRFACEGTRIIFIVQSIKNPLNVFMCKFSKDASFGFDVLPLLQRIAIDQEYGNWLRPSPFVLKDEIISLDKPNKNHKTSPTTEEN